MRYAGQVNVRAIEAGFAIAREGVTLAEIDTVVERTIRDGDCEPAFKGYRDYPATACIAVNDVAVHGIPNEYQLRHGDIVTIDVGTRWNGFCVDSARTRVLAQPDPDKGLHHQWWRRTCLQDAAEKILEAELQEVRDGVSLYDIAFAGEREAKRQQVNLMVQWGGHRIGETIHLDPFIPNGFDWSKGNFGVQMEKRRLQQTKLFAGDTICLEPVVTYGSTDIIIDQDGWTVRSKDSSDVAHTERTILVLKNGFEVFS